MSKLNLLLKELKQQKLELGYEINLPVSESCLNDTIKKIESLYRLELAKSFRRILKFCDGINFNGVFLYKCGSTYKTLQNILEANDGWHTYNDFSGHFFYAESDLYLFVQSIETGLFSYRPRDNFETVIFSTENDNLFFQIILECALGEDIESKYAN
ncbi:hypothetical protein AGMMS50239_07010 [Bacteroidia bacterium]|nr:hypothetical protein AGMMS50239_07010 [Bacteroidia bacterium]